MTEDIVFLKYVEIYVHKGFIFVEPKLYLSGIGFYYLRYLEIKIEVLLISFSILARVHEFEVNEKEMLIIPFNSYFLNSFVKFSSRSFIEPSVSRYGGCRRWRWRFRG